MLKTRVIPTLLWKGPGLVKGIGFDSWRRVGSVLPAITIYNTREVDEFILMDIEATMMGRDPDFELIGEYSRECFVPLTFGGGIRTIGQITQVLKAGADKVAINSASYDNPSLLTAASNRFGSQCIVAAIDYRMNPGAEPVCFSACGTICQNRSPVEWAREVERLGAGEILLTSIDRDGTMRGYDLEILSAVSGAVKIPVIASGGAGSYHHMGDAINVGGASAVAAASIFHFTEQTPLEAKAHLARLGISTRLPRKKVA